MISIKIGGSIFAVYVSTLPTIAMAGTQQQMQAKPEQLYLSSMFMVPADPARNERSG